MRTDTAVTATSAALRTVERMYAAFATGDLDALMDTVHPDSRWTYLGANPVITSIEFAGKAAIRGFFEVILRRLDMTSFDPEEVIVQHDTVVVIGSEAGTVRATGRPFRNRWVQKYVVDAGRITTMSEYNIQVEPA